MKGILAVVFLIYLATAFCVAEPLRVATWNVQNYLLQNRYEHGKFRFNYPKPEEQKAGIRQALIDIRADVLFLQEIGSTAFLLELKKDLAALGLSYPYSHCAHVPDTRSGLAVLSMLPLDSIVFHYPVPIQTGEFQESVRRGIQEVTFRVAGDSFRFLHVHLKSRYSSDPDDPQSERFRIAEIKALAAFLHPWMARFKTSSQLFLVGDFNTPFSSLLLDPLRAAWRPIPASDSRGLSWTYLYHRHDSRELIDGFWAPLSSPGLSASVLSWPSTPPSDHRPVLLTLPGS